MFLKPCDFTLDPVCHVTPSLGGTIRKEAWKIRRLITEFSRAARRPHWPRERAMRELFETAGITNPNTEDGISLTII